MLFRGLVNGFWLKVIMLFLMVLDHVYEFYNPAADLYLARFLAVAHILARVVAPVFAYLLAQGMVYTRSRERYILRLFIFAGIMAAGNVVITLVAGINIPNNIFFSLALGASLIYCIDKSKDGINRPLFILLSAVALIMSLFCEGGLLVPMICAVFYYFRGNKPLMYTVYILSAGLPYLLVYALDGRLQTQFYMVSAVIPIMLYNGRRGPDTAFAKYFFYIFYPLHVWAIVLVTFYLS